MRTDSRGLGGDQDTVHRGRPGRTQRRSPRCQPSLRSLSAQRPVRDGWTRRGHLLGSPNLHLPIAHRAGASLICTSETHSPPRVGVPSTSTHVYAGLKPLIPKPLAVDPTALTLPVAGSAANALTLAASAGVDTNPWPWPTRTNRRRMFSKAALLIGATCRFVDGDRRTLTPPNRPGPCAAVFKPRVVRAGDPRGSGMAAGRAELSMLGLELHRRLGGRERQ